MAVLPFSPKASLPAAKAAADECDCCFFSEGQMNYDRVLECLGNGSRVLGLSILIQVAMRLLLVRCKHPRYA